MNLCTRGDTVPLDPDPSDGHARFGWKALNEARPGRKKRIKKRTSATEAGPATGTGCDVVTRTSK